MPRIVSCGAGMQVWGRDGQRRRPRAHVPRAGRPPAAPPPCTRLQEHRMRARTSGAAGASVHFSQQSPKVWLWASGSKQKGAPHPEKALQGSPEKGPSTLPGRCSLYWGLCEGADLSVELGRHALHSLAFSNCCGAGCPQP